MLQERALSRLSALGTHLKSGLSTFPASASASKSPLLDDHGRKPVCLVMGAGAGIGQAVVSPEPGHFFLVTASQLIFSRYILDISLFLSFSLSLFLSFFLSRQENSLVKVTMLAWCGAGAQPHATTLV